MHIYICIYIYIYIYERCRAFSSVAFLAQDLALGQSHFPLRRRMAPAMAGKRRKTTDERCNRLVSLGKSSFVSQSGIAKLLAEVKKDDLPEAFSRTSQYRARKHVCQTQTPYGKLVESAEDGIPFQNPLAFLYYHYHNCPHYAHVVNTALQQFPCTAVTPWRLIIYQDGVNPGDGLALNHSRKTVVFYWSFVEYGMHALAHEEVWGTVCIYRTVDAKKLDGDIGKLFFNVLEQFFGPVHDIRLTGVMLVEGIRILAAVGVLLADEPALKEMLSCKGHSGNKCCCLCLNASLHKAKGIPLHILCPEVAVSIACTDWNSFDKHTDETIRALIRRLNAHHARFEAGELTRDKYDLISAMLGWNWTAHNIILNEKFRLQVASSVMWDWAHTYVCEGLADIEFGQCMKRLQRTPNTFMDAGAYVSTFSFPKAHSSRCGQLFSVEAAHKNYKKGSFTSTASEFMTLTPVLHRYFTRVVEPRVQRSSTETGCMPFVKSMIAVLTVVMMLQAVKTGVISSDELFVAIVAHLTLYTEAYGDDAVRPKHHYALHLPDMLRKFGFLLATFTHERKHRVVKRYTKNRMNLKKWALGAIEEITCHQIWENKVPFFLACSTAYPKKSMLPGLRELFPGVAELTLHNRVKCNGGQASAGDVVSCLVEGTIEIGKLLMTVGVENELVSVFSLWERSNMDTDMTWMTLFVKDNVVKVQTKNIDTVCTYRMSGDGNSCVVHLPYELRPE